MVECWQATHVKLGQKCMLALVLAPLVENISPSNAPTLAVAAAAAAAAVVAGCGSA
jgi:hypothetical protein